MEETGKIGRRPLKTRQALWANRLAKSLVSKGVQPNQVSSLSMVFALLAYISFKLTDMPLSLNAEVAFYVLAAVFIQLRLLANMLDGMLAIEGGLKTKWGDVYNEVPDRVSDTLILVGAGYSLGPPGITLGWMAACFAAMTAYVRLFGISIGTSSFYTGPMAKPHRMFVLTVACLLSAFGAAHGNADEFMRFALWIVVAGSFLTCLYRLFLILKELDHAR